jgi:SAM-dependent methyltransferase
MKSFYGDNPKFDGYRAWCEFLSTQYDSSSVVLDVGCGKRCGTDILLFKRVAKLIGIDVIEDVMLNKELHEGRVFDGVTFPFPDETFDLIVSTWVLEHLTDPLSHFKEVKRCLKPEGRYCFRTPGSWHYVTLGSKIIPHSFHNGLVRWLKKMPQKIHDPFPAYYLANSSRRIRKLATKAGLDVKAIEAREFSPSYHGNSPLMLAPVIAYERMVNASPIFKPLRHSLDGCLVKKQLAAG